MSRLIIKGLPKRLEEKELRELFSFAGEVTDAKVIRARDGISRQFGFVGFRSEADAARARKRLNGTYVQSSRVLVEVARAAGDPNIPRPWSKHSKGSSAYEKRVDREENLEVEKRRAEARKLAKEVRERKELEKKEALKTGDIDEKDKEAFGAFKEAVGKRSRNPIWADGEVGKKAIEAEVNGIGKDPAAEKGGLVFASDEDDDPDEDYQELPTDRKDEKNEDTHTQNLKSNPVALDDAVSDGDYFKSKISNAIDEDSDNANSEDEESDSASEESSSESGIDVNANDSKPSANTKPNSNGLNINAANDYSSGPSESIPGQTTADKSEIESEPHKIDAAETGRLFVRNLSFNVSEEDLESLFEKYGTLADVHLVTDPTTKRSRGVALVLYVIPENAAKAMAALDGTIFCGRLLHVLPGRPRPGNTRATLPATGAGVVGMNTFKSGREEARAEAARSGADVHAQNAMHLGADAVADTVAQRLGVSKAELYGTDRGESGAAAVRLAVAEATVQAETRQFLLQNGIDLSKAANASMEMNANTKLARRKRMSRTAFLVKNLPARTKEAELQNMFSKFGSLNRLVLPPSGLLAVIEYSNAGEAKRAYGGLAYKRFRDVPLYLEWLPSEAVSGTPMSEPGKSTAKQDHDDGVESVSMPRDGPDSQSGVIVNASSVYVKNLNFDTREDALKSHFKQILKRRPDVVKGMRALTIATKKNPKDPSGTRLSMGFGFAEFASSALAGEAVKLAQGSVLDGHTLELRLSNRIVESGNTPSKKRGRNEKNGKQKPSPKLIVRNIAFEATSRDVRDLFATFGQIKSVRLPRKMDGSHRGFGFLEFVSKNEAKAAMSALGDAHLYGRHLVIEYADEDSDGFASLEKLQENAAKQMPKSKRRRAENGERDGADDIADEEERMRDELYR